MYNKTFNKIFFVLSNRMEKNSSKKPLRRKAISLATKQKILRVVAENKLTYQEIANNFGYSKGTISDIVKNRVKYENIENNSERKKLRESNYPKLDEALLLWIRQMRSKNVAINGNLLKEKACEYGDKLNLPNFVASNGYLDRFKKRHGLKFMNIVGEKQSVPTEVYENWLENLPNILKNYEPKNVYNLDETGLFYKLMPSKTIAFKNEDCSGGKWSKERLTVLVGANADGSDKLPLLVIGKSANPRCFKGIKTLPTMYASNRRAWMTSKEWQVYLKNLDKKFTKEMRKVLFVADNCPSHCPVSGLKSIKFQFLPPNVTAVAQPMDQGVIKILKGYYREQVLRKIVLCIESEEVSSAFDAKINVLEALHFINKSWDRVKKESIENCFKKAGFFTSVCTVRQASNFDNADNLNLLWNENNLQAIALNTPIADYLEIDEMVQTSHSVTDDDILGAVAPTIHVDDSSDSDSGELIDKPSNKEIYRAINIIRRALGEGENMEPELHCLNAIENAIDELNIQNKVQSKITDFFSK